MLKNKEQKKKERATSPLCFRPGSACLRQGVQAVERLTLVSRSPVGLAQTLPFIHYLLSYLLKLFSLNRVEEQSVPGPPSTAVSLCSESCCELQRQPPGWEQDLSSWVTCLYLPDQPGYPLSLAVLQRSSQSGTWVHGHWWRRNRARNLSRI
jgi:hypothetical protein